MPHQPLRARRIVVLAVLSLAGLAVSGGRVAGAGLEEDYNQWKQALTNHATGAGSISVPPQFTIELLRSAQSNEGSWVAMTFDPAGRLVVAREDRGLLRMTLSSSGSSVERVETINTNLYECRGLLFAYGALYANANNSKVLVRLRDTKGTGQFDEITVLRTTPGGVGHGRNQLALGPDGMIYSIHGDDVGLPAEGADAGSPLRHYGEDRLLPCAWDQHLFNAYAKPPYGHLIRTDRDGHRWELVAGGLRNPFGIDFNEAGDLFTFDADMEWDVGLSWYHPTRVLHLVEGGDYGWRRGTGVLPAWAADTLPSVVDIGLSSPTAIKFGTKSNWPEPWRSALYILDWAYGKIDAVHLQPSGASYRGRAEVFAKGRPLNVTGVEFGPDGAMYFVTGGRRTQSGLYRVAWTGAPATPAAKNQAPRHAAPGRTMDLWSRLDDEDRWIRHAARVELERRPVEEWREQALRESRPNAALTALLALSRAGEGNLQARILRRIKEVTSGSLTPEQQLIAVRAEQVCLIRMGHPGSEAAEDAARFWDSLYPGTDSRVNQGLCELLVYLHGTNTVRKTLSLLEKAATQEEKFHYLFTLRLVTNGWTLPERRAYFNWLRRARTEFQGANMLATSLNYIRADAEATLSAAEAAELKDSLSALHAPAVAVPAAPAVQRAFVADWKMSDLEGDLAKAKSGRDLARGRRLFAEAGCIQCHRVGSEGGFVGPELTAVASRFDRRTILESILEPSKVVAETYRPVTITLKSGAMCDGRIISDNGKTIVLAVNPTDPDQRRQIAKTDIAAQTVSELSPMPAGLANTLTREEILDLIAWLESGGSGNTN